MEQTITIEGYPEFILEANNAGLFYIVNEISFEANKPGAWNYKWRENDKGLIVLRKGLDIIETPSRNVSILIRMDNQSNFGVYLLRELKKHADIGGYDYVSFEKFGAHATNFLGRDGKWELREAKSRYFRKVPQDDLM